MAVAEATAMCIGTVLVGPPGGSGGGRSQQQSPAGAGRDSGVADYGLTTLTDAMAAGDEFLTRVVTVALLSRLDDPEAIGYRQQVLTDCLEHPSLARELYGLAGDALAVEKKIWAPFRADTPDSALSWSMNMLEALLPLPLLLRLRQLAERHRGQVQSAGLTALFDLLIAELDEAYLALVADQLQQLQFRRGLLLSAELGGDLRGVGHVIRRPGRSPSRWSELFGHGDGSSFSFSVPERDEAGWRAVAELRDEGLAGLAKAATEAADHLLAFFTMLRREIGFYVGCVQLHVRLTAAGEATCLPVPVPPGEPRLRCAGLYEPGLALRGEVAVVGNDIDADGRSMIVVTGANQGGKSTFLRSVGIAQLMMQCGMFVPAQAYTATAYREILTHYRREEDASMTSGKLDEELARMNSIADVVRRGSLLLSNESFASTNEREGAQIGRHVFGAMTSCGVTVVAVTHLFDLADSLYRAGGPTLFLRAERQPDGGRDFRLVEGRPLSTGYGRDLYERVFGSISVEPTATTSNGHAAVPASLID